MAKRFVRTLFQELKDEDLEDIAGYVFPIARYMGERKEPVPDEEEWDKILRNIRKTMATFPRVRNSERITIDLEEEECIRTYDDGDTELYDIVESPWRKIANMEVVSMDCSTHDSYCKSMAILILAFTEEGWTLETAEKNQKEFWDWVDKLDKLLVKKERRRNTEWPPKKPGRKKKGII